MSAIPCVDVVPAATGWRAALNARALANVAEVLRGGFRAGVNGKWVRELEERFAAYVGAQYAIAMANGTATLHTAVRVLSRPPIYPYPGEHDCWTVSPLTMAATTAALYAERVEIGYRDVDPLNWVANTRMSVSLYGAPAGPDAEVDDAAQRLGPAHPTARFTSYSFQASKHLTCGEGGMLVTNDRALADAARSFASLGYDLGVSRARIDHRAIKLPDTIRHVRFGLNYRMSDLQAAVLLAYLEHADELIAERRACAAMYQQAHEGCAWLLPQAVPAGARHAYWCYPLALDRAEKWHRMADAIERHGGERLYGAWRLTYQEPAYASPASAGSCPVAEWLQPRLMQFQTNDVRQAERNAVALSAAIREVGG